MQFATGIVYCPARTAPDYFNALAHRGTGLRGDEVRNLCGDQITVLPNPTGSKLETVWRIDRGLTKTNSAQEHACVNLVIQLHQT